MNENLEKNIVYEFSKPPFDAPKQNLTLCIFKDGAGVRYKDYYFLGFDLNGYVMRGQLVDESLIIRKKKIK